MTALDHERRTRLNQQRDLRSDATHQEAVADWARINELEQKRLRLFVESFDHPFYLKLRPQALERQPFSRRQAAVITKIAADNDYSATRALRERSS